MLTQKRANCVCHVLRNKGGCVTFSAGAEGQAGEGVPGQRSPCRQPTPDAAPGTDPSVRDEQSGAIPKWICLRHQDSVCGRAVEWETEGT